MTEFPIYCDYIHVHDVYVHNRSDLYMKEVLYAKVETLLFSLKLVCLALIFTILL